MKLKTLLLTSLALILPNSIWAVMLSPDNQGQVLIFPYFGTLGGNSTNITVSSHNSSAKALKVHFRDRQGDMVRSFNLYLENDGSWVAGLGQIDGETHLNLPDSSCIFPSVDIGSGSIPLPVNSGYLEVIEMGTIIDQDIVQIVEESDCDALNAMWTGSGQWVNDPSFGLGPPVGNVRGSASLINVGRGSMYSFVATALSAFSDIQQHTAPGEQSPDLTSAHDAGTETNATTSVVCINGECIEDTWERPVDAVAATLMVRSLGGEFSIEPEIGASSEVLLTFPLRKFYFDEGNPAQSNIFVNLFIFDRNGVGERLETICIPPVLTPCNAPYTDVLLPSVNILSFNSLVSDYETSITSNVLSEQQVSFFPSPQFPVIEESGQFQIYLAYALDDSIVSNSDRRYVGYSAIGTVLQEFVNGYLVGDTGQSVRANYGNAFTLSRNNGESP